jgi:hypothetical protein
MNQNKENESQNQNQQVESEEDSALPISWSPLDSITIINQTSESHLSASIFGGITRSRCQPNLDQ